MSTNCAIFTAVASVGIGGNVTAVLPQSGGGGVACADVGDVLRGTFDVGGAVNAAESRKDLWEFDRVEKIKIKTLMRF